MSDRPHADSTPLQSNPVLPAGITVAVWVAILLVAFGSLHFFFARNLTQLYGDTLAHMEAARRLFDSLTPGYGEIGNVWLPLFHLLAAPLALSDHLWRTGLAGTDLIQTGRNLAADLEAPGSGSPTSLRKPLERVTPRNPPERVRNPPVD